MDITLLRNQYHDELIIILVLIRFKYYVAQYMYI